MSPPHRVAITGLGIVSAIGCDLENFWNALQSGSTGIATLTSVDPEILTFSSGAEIPEFDADAVLDRKDAVQLDRFAQFALAACQDAVQDCGLDPAVLASPRCGVVLGAGLGGQETLDQSFKGLYRDGGRRANPLTIPKIMPNAAASRISLNVGATGPSFTVCTACSSSNHAMGNAFWMIRSGLLDVAVTGGSDAPFSLGNLLAWSGMRVVSPDTCRPFSADRKGMVLGEGSGILILERMDHALARNARIYGEVAGFGMSSDAHHLVIPSQDGAVQAMRAALEDGNLPAADVGYINAHGTGTPVNDKVESEAINEVFGTHTREIAVNSTKGAHGHGLGTAGALEAVATVLALSRRSIPPTANYREPDPECTVDVVTGSPRDKAVKAALSNSFAFGGLNAVLAFRAHAQ